MKSLLGLILINEVFLMRLQSPSTIQASLYLLGEKLVFNLSLISFR